MNAAIALRPCEFCGFLTCEEPNQCATVLRLSRDERERQAAEERLPPDPYAVTCHCGADSTHSDEAYGYCEEHAPADAYEAVF